MTSEKFDTLLLAMIDSTREGKIRWSPTADQNAFRIALGSGIVQLEMSERANGGKRYAAYLLTREGRLLDEVEDGGAAPRSWLRELYGLARASALRIDRVVDEMLADLQNGRTRLPPPDAGFGA